MNTRVLVLTCSIATAALVACGGSDKPAQDPSMTSTSTTAGSPDVSAPATPMASNTNTSSTLTSDTTPMTTPAPQPPSNAAPSNVAPTPAPSPGATPSAMTGTAPTPDSGKNVDNTKMNQRDRSGSTLTPMDQGNSGSETKITATIRKGMMADKTLSFTAKNVKVITVGSKVTLRGPVKSDQEKSTIEALVRQTAGVTDVDNQLEVKK